MTYKPKTTSEQRAAMCDVVREKLPALGNVMRDLVSDLERAELALNTMATDTVTLHAMGEELTMYPLEDESECLHPQFDWDFDRDPPVRYCVYCGAEDE